MLSDKGNCFTSARPLLESQTSSSNRRLVATELGCGSDLQEKDTKREQQHRLDSIKRDKELQQSPLDNGGNLPFSRVDESPDNNV